MRNIKHRTGIDAPISALLFFGLMVFISNCASTRPGHINYDPPFLDIIIRPLNLDRISGNTLGIFNFSFTNKGSAGYSTAFSEYLQLGLLKGNFIRTIELTGSEYQDIENAVNFGREKGYDFICVGNVDTLFWGGLGTNSKAVITLKIIDTKSAVTLWLIRGQMVGEYQPLSDDLFFKKESKPAPSPVILSQLILDGIIKTLLSITP